MRFRFIGKMYEKKVCAYEYRVNYHYYGKEVDTFYTIVGNEFWWAIKTRRRHNLMAPTSMKLATV
jgi:hypothetical protein